MLAQGLSALRPLNKAVLVVAGYLLAILAAFLVVSIHYVATDGPDRQASSGMYSFADGLLFLAVFGFASIPASCAALCFLRQVQRFWSALSFVALSIASTGLVALYACFARPSAIADSVLYVVNRKYSTLSATRWRSLAHRRRAPRLPMPFGFASHNAAEEHLRALARKGTIMLEPGSARGIRLVEQLGLPLIGSVAAGSPILAVENVQRRYTLDAGLFSPRADFLLRVRGLSMHQCRNSGG
jgi:hypothetical protein